MREGNDDVRRRYNAHLNNPDLFDFAPLVALIRAMLEHFVNRANLAETEDVDGLLQRAVSLAERLLTIMERVADVERRVGPVRPAEVERFLAAVGIVLATHLEPAQLPAAQQQLEELLSRDDKHPMGRLHEFERPLAPPTGADGAGQERA
jgi:hypothetical protein